MAIRLEVWNAVAVVAVTAAAYWVMKFLWNGVLEPLRLHRIMTKQGVKGPPFRPFVGQLPETAAFAKSYPQVLPLENFANFMPTVTPQFALYFPKYGKTFVYSFGPITRLAVRDPDIVKELLVTNHGNLVKQPIEALIATKLVGRGLLGLVGEKWAIERRIFSPFFFQDILKGMVAGMVEGSITQIQSWEQTVAEAGGIAEVDVDPGVHVISGRILSRTSFGGDYEKGDQISELQSRLAKELFISIQNPAFWIMPHLYWKLPTERNRLMDQLSSKIDALLHETINGRRDAVRKGETSSYGDDLLGRMIGAASDGWDEDTNDFNLASVFNNCKLVYFAGQDTVASTVGSAMLMMALHPEWQDRARKEVLEVVGNGDNFDGNVVSRLKVVGMIVYETLRIFSPEPSFTRVAAKDLHVKGLLIPKGLALEFAGGAMQHDKDYWGLDVGKFNPERFANGVSGATTHSQAFLPFGFGPKVCIGNNLAIMEAKVILSMVLRRFELFPSPNYKHYHSFSMVLVPTYGLPIILKAL